MTQECRAAARLPRRRSGLAIALVLAGACDDGFDSSEGLLHFETPTVMATPPNDMGADAPLLSGTTFCPTISCNTEDCPDPETADFRDCFFERVLGAGDLVEDGCVRIDEAGEVVWWFEAVSCDANDQGYSPIDDELILTGIDGAGITGGVEFWAEAFAEQSLEPALYNFPGDWVPNAGDVIPVLAGQDVMLPVVLRHVDYASAVAWVPDEATFTLTQTGSGEVSLTHEERAGWIRLAVPQGGAATLTMDLHGHSWDVARVESVAEDDISRLSVVASTWTDEDAGTTEPVGARAVVRDSTGRVVFGTPVAWSERKGVLALGPLTLAAGPDYTALHDECTPPSQQTERQKASLRAEWGRLSDTVTIEWTPRTAADPEWGADPDADWTPHPQCDPGCGCAAASPTSLGLGGVWVLLAIARRRRD